MPSYRPQQKSSHGSRANDRASAWSKRRPAGVGTTTSGGAAAPESAKTVSSASPHGSGRITIPAPPP